MGSPTLSSLVDGNADFQPLSSQPTPRLRLGRLTSVLSWDTATERRGYSVMSPAPAYVRATAWQANLCPLKAKRCSRAILQSARNKPGTRKNKQRRAHRRAFVSEKRQ